MKYRVKHIVEYGLFRSISWLFGILPHRLALALIWPFAKLTFLFGGRRLQRACTRIRQVLGPDVPEARVRDITWKAWRHLLFMAVESMRIPRTTPEWVRRHMVLDDVDEVLNTLKTGQSAITAVPHMGNWELAGIALHSLGVDLFTLVRRQKNPLMNRWMNQVRMSTGVDVVDTQSREIATIPQKLKSHPCVLAILPDVRAKRGGVRVRFLGGETTLPAGAAQYARDAGIPIFTAMVYRQGWTQHGWKKSGWIAPDYTLDEAADIQRIMQYVADRFTESIRANPENYFWFNKRWVLNEE